METYLSEIGVVITMYGSRLPMLNFIFSLRHFLEKKNSFEFNPKAFQSWNQANVTTKISINNNFRIIEI